MAECQVKLPLELLGDGEKENCWGNEHGFPCGFPCDMGSDLNSPLSFTSETGSDEDEDYLDGLTRRMAHSFLLDDDDKDPRNICNPRASGIMATSPQSTLCDVGLWSGSGTTSPKGRPLSPPVTAAAAMVDVLYSAAGHVALARLQAQAEAEKLYGRGPLAHPRNNYYLKQQQFEQLKLQQKPTDGEAGWSLGTAERGWAEPRPHGRCCRPLDLPPSAWPPLQGRQHPPQLPTQQQQHHQELVTAGSRMRAAFLQSGRRRTSNGTGVFLPQRTMNHAQSRKKPACSTVLLPARVVQALNLNLEDMGRHPHLPGTFVLDHGALLSRGNALKRSHVIRSQPPFAVAATAAAAHEVRLPAEWTY